ncbi:MAG: SPFH domain-containing protein [Treponema sp.]|nr:SPFH domain-containing protein [Treponema sp.]
MDNDKEAQAPRTRKFPVVLLITAGIFSSVASAYAGISAIILSLGYLMFTMSFFLVLIAVFHKIKMAKPKRGDEKTAEPGEGAASPPHPSPLLSSLKKNLSDVWMRITRFYLDERIPPKTEDSAGAAKTAEHTGHSSGLIEIQKAKEAKQGQQAPVPARARYEVLYVISFIVLAVWRLSGMFTIVPLAHTAFHVTIVDAILLLVFPCVAVTYLKMRKDEGARPGDKTSRDLLTLLSYVSLVYAAVIAVALVLNANILPALQWVFYAAMLYFIAALALNIVLSILKNKIIGDFNYPLIPKPSKADSASEAFFDSEEVRLNFSLKSLYTIKYTLKVLPGLLLALGGVLLLSTSIFVVHPHQRAAVYRFGRLTQSSIVGEGIHFKLPWPIDRVDIVDVYRVNSIQIGYVSAGDINFLWAHFHDGGEYLLLLGNGNEKVSVNMRIMYNISDLYAYITTSTRPRDILSAAAYEALMNRTVNTTLDAFLNIDRSSLSVSIMEELSALSAAQGLGLSVEQIIIEGIHPPADVANVYQMVISASIDRNTIITNAETEAERRLIDADRESRSIVNYAQARQYYRVSAALQEMAVFHAAAEAHGINSESFEMARYLEVFERVMESSSVHVFSPGMEGSIHRSVLGQPQLPGAWGF